MVIDGNIVYSNTNTPNCTTQSCYATARIPTAAASSWTTTNASAGTTSPYKGAFLISNNVVYLNGGRGIHIYRSDNATIVNNTMWSNNQDPTRPSGTRARCPA